ERTVLVDCRDCAMAGNSPATRKRTAKATTSLRSVNIGSFLSTPRAPESCGRGCCFGCTAPRICCARHPVRLWWVLGTTCLNSRNRDRFLLFRTPRSDLLWAVGWYTVQPDKPSLFIWAVQTASEKAPSRPAPTLLPFP